MAHLNGWQRLWVLMSALYAVPVAVLAYAYFPSSDVRHSDDFYKQMSAASLAKLAVYQENTKFIDPDDIEINAQLPNGHVLPFRKGVTEEQRGTVIREYYGLVDQATIAKRMHVIGYSLLGWLLPCIAIYLLGSGIAWVRRGFYGSQRAP